MLLFLDNFDSFTYNLVHSFESLGQEVEVIKNKELTVNQCLEKKPQGIVIGPGPGNPSGAGISKELILAAAQSIPVLGVCLGHQALAECFSGQTIKAPCPMHGKSSQIYHCHQGLFKNVPQGFIATRYHSLMVDPDSLPSCLTITARTHDNVIMALQHKHYELHSVQFHPESVLTEHGAIIFNNFLSLI
ncbi:MAG: aminodeoxychorismate/anthranilate synthase component II [Parachlamydiales bacterium]|nr:aminodeoxychorismate/anthranilate synthase component II [Parachlamydiales bacterium]